MAWNWEKSDWPNFTWKESRLKRAEAHFLKGVGMFVGEWKHLSSIDREVITVDAMSNEALTTSEIEGEILDRASVQSSIRKQLGLESDRQTAKPAEQGIAEMMVDLYRFSSKPLSKTMLCAWHKMIMKGRRDIKDFGRYRADLQPMRVVSGALHSAKVHFEAPPSKKVPKEMERFVTWFNQTAPHGSDPLPPLTRAGLAHLYFESIHPFEDGNGRIGRAISEKALAQCSSQPSLNALAATVMLRRKSYYAALETASKANEITEWLSWFAGVAIEAQLRTASRVEFLIDKTRLLDTLREQINPRQEKALLRMFREGPDGFAGGLSAGKYAKITRASPATSTRDLADLVMKGALKRTGERRHARYDLTVPLRTVSSVTIEEDGMLRFSSAKKRG